MSWMRNRAPTSRAVLIGAAAIGLAASACAGHAATIVIRSNGPSANAFPPGKSLPGTAIVLKAGDVITVLDAAGTRVLRGPGKVAVSGGGQANVNGIAALIADTGARQSRTGATRGSSSLAAPHPANLWYVDVARGGNFCVANVKALALWRANSDAAASLTIVATGAGATRVPIAFRPGQAVAAWPLSALPVADGSQFRIEGAGRVTIVTRLLPSSPATLDDAARALLDHGCTAQVDTLVAATAADPGS